MDTSLLYGALAVLLLIIVGWFSFRSSQKSSRSQPHAAGTDHGPRQAKGPAEHLEDLREQGHLTDEEYERRRERLEKK